MASRIHFYNWNTNYFQFGIQTVIAVENICNFEVIFSNYRTRFFPSDSKVKLANNLVPSRHEFNHSKSAIVIIQFSSKLLQIVNSFVCTRTLLINIHANNLLLFYCQTFHTVWCSNESVEIIVLFEIYGDSRLWSRRYDHIPI